MGIHVGVNVGIRGGRGRLAGLLASSSVAALLMGSGGPAAAACYTGPFTGGYTNSGAANCIVINNTSFTGKLGNTGTISPGPTGIAVINHSTITGQISDSGVISATSHGILIDSTSKISAAASSAISITGPTFTGGISNAGTIAAGSTGIYVSGVSTFTGGITNSGTMTGGSGIKLYRFSQFGGGISNAGTISVGGTGIYVNGVSTFAGGISNGGTISAGGYGIKLTSVAQFGTSSAGGSISNSGTIASTRTGIFADHVSVFTGGISNAGTITTNKIGIYLSSVAQFGTSSAGGGIANSGTISASSTGIYLNRVKTFFGGISNSGTIASAGEFGIKVTNAVQFGSSAGGGIANSGTISARGPGIYVSEITTFAGGISNSGTISAGNTAGIYVSSITTFSGGISNSGTISASRGPGIFVSSVAQFSASSTGGGIINSGTISGAVGILVKNSGAVSIFDSGVIVGTGGTAVDLTGNAAGNIFTLGPGYSITGLVKGQGADTFQLGGSGSASFNLSNIGTQYTGFGTFNVVGGTWTVTGASSQNWTITPGGTLLIGSSTTTIGPNLTDNGAFGFAQSGAYTYGNVIAGTGLVEQLGPGTTTLSAVNSYSGGTVINAGRLAVSADNNLGNAAGRLSFGGGTLQFLAAFSTARTITLNASGGTFDTSGNNDTLSGTIGGAGGLTKIGAGTLTLSGGNSYSGPTNVDAGTLLASAATAFSPASNFNVATGATLDFSNFNQTLGALSGGGNVALGSAALTVGGNNADTTFSGTISGTGGLTKTGSGALTLTGTDSYSGATAVNGGILNVQGMLTGTSDVTVNAGGTLTGTGTVDPLTVTIASGGALTPGTAGVAGTSMTITGNLAFASGAAYLVTLNPATASFASVSGAATLNGTVQASFAPGSYISKHYTILTAGSISGSFAALANTNLPSNFHDSLSYDTSHAYLDLALNFSTPQASSLSGNQNNVAGALINSFNTAGGIPMKFAALPASALTALDGEAGTGAGKGATRLMTDFMALMLDPTAGGGSVNGGSAAGFAPEQDTSLPADVALAYAKALKAPPPEGSGWGGFDQRWSAWGSAFGGTSFINGDAALGTNNVTASDYGFAAGMERHLTPDTVFGFGLAGGGTQWNLAQALGSGRSDSFQAGLYAKTHAGPLYLSGALAFANHWFTTDRTALGDQLQAKFAGQSYAARGEAGYRYAVPVTGAQNAGAIIGVTPYAALQVQDFHTPGYGETDLTGGGFGLTYASQNATDTRSELGARFDNLQVVNGMPLVLRGRLAWAHDWTTNATALNAAFQTLPGSNFTLNGATPPKNAALTTAAAELHLTSSWTAIAKFDGEFASGAQTYGGTGTLRYAW